MGQLKPDWNIESQVSKKNPGNVCKFLPASVTEMSLGFVAPSGSGTATCAARAGLTST